jgi:hypothetical protein
MSVILQNSFSLSNLSCNVDNRDGGSLVVAAAAWQWQRRWWRRRGVSDSGRSLAVIWRWRWQRDYESGDEAELMEENFGNKEEDEDTFRG